MKKRIEYIDAMRGFTMLLVVIQHVATFNMGYSEHSTFNYHSIFSEFRMPLFFFVSGFVFYKSGFEWDFKNTYSFIKKKVSVQIVSPLLFMCIFLFTRDQSLLEGVYSSHKGGYWFTFTLFEYYLFYIAIQWLLRLICKNKIIENVLVLFVGILLYCSTVYTMLDKWPISERIRDIIGVPVWGYFIYFIIGTLVRKYFTQVEYIIDHTPVFIIALTSFVCLNVLSDFFLKISNSLYFLICALSGITIVFVFFRNNSVNLTKSTKLGNVLQYVGRRTLDIYLLHYFFVVSNMSSVLPDFGLLQSPFIEFCISLFFAILVVAACLFVSKVIRTSPFAAHFLFGAKRVC